MNSSGRVALALLLALLVGFTRGTQGQVVSAKVMRSSNVRQHDLYRKEEVVTVTATGGVIQSPRYPNAYPRNLQLSWKLLSPHNTRITLEFDSHFVLEEPENEVCRYDFVEVEDISETSTIVWGRWCGQRVPPRLTSKTNTLKVTFKSDDYFVAKPGFKLHFSLHDDSLPTASKTNWEAVTLMEDSLSVLAPAVTDVPLTAAALDQTIAAFNTVEQLLRHLNPDSWRQDLDNLYRETAMFRPRTYQHSRQNKIELDRLYDDVKRYSCTPRNYSVNLREELRATNAVFFPRCLLVQRCGGNCACGTDNWNSCTCSPAKTSDKLHEIKDECVWTGTFRPTRRSNHINSQTRNVPNMENQNCTPQMKRKTIVHPRWKGYAFGISVIFYVCNICMPCVCTALCNGC